jgi:hypothetical protein
MLKMMVTKNSQILTKMTAKLSMAVKMAPRERSYQRQRARQRTRKRAKRRSRAVLLLPTKNSPTYWTAIPTRKRKKNI